MPVRGVRSARVNLLVDLNLATHDAVLADMSVLAKAITDASFKADKIDTKRSGRSSAPTQSRPIEFRVEFETNRQAFNVSKMFRMSEAVMSAETNEKSNATQIRLNEGYIKQMC